MPETRQQSLDKAFNPECVAVVGASSTRGKWSNDVFRQMAEGFGGTLVPVNPNRDSIEGVAAYPSIEAVPFGIDYAVVVVARDQVLEAVRQCVKAKVPVVHVLSSGFAEVSEAGREMQEQLVDALRGGETALIGPNSLGLYSARAGLTFVWGSHFRPGPIAFVSQSGGLCYDVLTRGQARGLAFGKILSVGNCADLDWSDFLRYFADDPETETIALYVEGIGNGQELFRELREAAKHKTVIVLKGGKTRSGQKSALSHTGRLAGDYEVWRAMARQAGVVEVDSLDSLLIELESGTVGAADSGGTMVIGTGGGATVLIADACDAAGVRIAELQPGTVSELDRQVPGGEELGGVGNPLEIGADRLLAEPDLLASLTDAALRDPDVGSVLVHLNLAAVANNLAGGPEAWGSACGKLAEAARPGKAICVVLRNGDDGGMPADLLRLARERLQPRPGLAAYSRLDDALRLLARPGPNLSGGNTGGVDLEQIGSASRPGDSPTRMLDGAEARACAEEYGIAFSEWRAVSDLDSALQSAEAVGYPVALKSAASDIAHKSDAGCVRTGIDSAEGLGEAFRTVTTNARQAGSASPESVLVEKMVPEGIEFAVGLKRSETFGPVVLAGMGGIWVEILEDYALRVCPVTEDEAVGMLEELKAWPVLTGARGRPACDVLALARTVAAVSRLGSDSGHIAEFDLNPVIVHGVGNGAVAVDARIIVDT